MTDISIYRSTLLTVLLSSALLMTACQTTEAPQEKPPLKLYKKTFSDIENWNSNPDQYAGSLDAFQKSCARFLKLSPDTKTGMGTFASEWQEVCRHAPQTAIGAHAKSFFETYFTPYQAFSGESETGLFTGYYEASLNGSHVKDATYSTPLRARPADLVMVNLGEFVPDLKGQRIAGRVQSGQLKPYEDRAQIEAGKLPKDMDKPLLWVDSAVDAFFLQIQGSGVVTFADGTTQRVGYDGQNGHVYTAIGKELIARGALTKDNVSMQTIRDWLQKNPDKAKEILQTNKSYVFFKKLDTAGPIGGEGVVLTPEYSLAVDRAIWTYGVPLFVDINAPSKESSLKRLMIAQDTGGAIKGNIRGDVFWGYGDRAAALAGPLQSQGKMWALLPKTSNVVISE